MARKTGGVTMTRTALAILVAAAAAGCSRDPAKASRASMAKGAQYVQSGKFKEAAIEYRNAIKQVPQSVEAHAKLADAAKGANDANTALIEYLRVAEPRSRAVVDGDRTHRSGGTVLASRCSGARRRSTRTHRLPRRRQSAARCRTRARSIDQTAGHARSGGPASGRNPICDGSPARG